MRYKLIAIDLDGTLLNKDNIITPYTIDIIKKLDRQGVKIVIATGRSYSALRDKIAPLNLNHPVVCYNGAMLRNGGTHEILYNSTIPHDMVADLITISRNKNIPLFGYLDGQFLYEYESEYSELYKGVTGLTGEIVNFDKLKSINFTKAMFIYDHSILEDLQKELKPKYSKELHIAFSKPIFLEVMNITASKSKGLDRVAKMFNIPREDILAFGDGMNDADMLEYAGKGVVMKNGHEELRAKFESTEYGNNEDGVAKYLEGLLHG